VASTIPSGESDSLRSVIVAGGASPNTLQKTKSKAKKDEFGAFRRGKTDDGGEKNGVKKQGKLFIENSATTDIVGDRKKKLPLKNQMGVTIAKSSGNSCTQQGNRLQWSRKRDRTAIGTLGEHNKVRENSLNLLKGGSEQKSVCSELNFPGLQTLDRAPRGRLISSVYL